MLRLLPPSFDCTRDLLGALLLSEQEGDTDHMAALPLYFRTHLDEAWRLELRQAARDWATSTGNVRCLSSLERLEAARSAGLDVNVGGDPDGRLLLTHEDYEQAESVAVLLATEPSLDPSLSLTTTLTKESCGTTWLHLTIGYARTDVLKTFLATPGA